MVLRWRNGVLNIGPILHSWGWGIQLAWNRKQSHVQGEPAFADYACLDWQPGRWLPQYIRRK